MLSGAALFEQAGGTVTVHGTAADDRFVLNLSAAPVLTINGISHSLDAATVTSVAIDGGGGNDVAIVRGSLADEWGEIYPGSATFQSQGLTVEVTACTAITLIGAGGADAVDLYDSPGDDALLADPQTARLEGPGFVNRAEEFDVVHVYAKAGGRDVAELVDSAGDDRFVGTPIEARMVGSGFLVRAKFFEYVHGYAKSGGADSAFLYDSAGNDQLVGYPMYTALTGDDFFLRAKFFDAVHAYSYSGGYDTARFFDSSGDDTLEATTAEAGLSGPGFFNRAVRFERVQTYASAGGDDRARLNGGAGNDYFRYAPDHASLAGPNYRHEVTGFGTVDAVAGSGGNDIAELDDSPGDDVFIAAPSEASLTGEGFVARARHFDFVHAYGRSGGHDVARLYDSPGDDAYVGRADYGVLKGDGFFNRAKFFDAVYAYARAGGTDTAMLYDSSGSDAFVGRPLYSRIEGDGFLHRVETFASVAAYAFGGGTDEALLVGYRGLDVVTSQGNWTRLSGAEPRHDLAAAGFEEVDVRLDDRYRAAESTTGGPAALSGVQISAADYYDPDSPTLGIQDAIDALPLEGGVVVIPAGTWTLRHSLVLRSGVTLHGAGAETILARSGPLPETGLTATARDGDISVAVQTTEGFQVGDEVFLNSLGIPSEDALHAIIAEIEPGRITFTEPIRTSYLLTPEGYGRLIGYHALIRTPWLREEVPVTRLTVEEMAIEVQTPTEYFPWMASAPAAVHLANATESMVRNVSVRDAYGIGVMFRGGHDNLVEDVLVERSRLGGIYLVAERDSVARGSTVRYTGYSSRMRWAEGIVVADGRNVRVEGNLSEYNWGNGLHVAGSAGIDFDSFWVNNISRHNGRAGFYLCRDTSGTYFSGNLVADNRLYGISGLGLGGPYGNRFVTITNNTIRDNAQWGIQAISSRHNVISDNILLDNSQAQPGRYAGILLLDTTDTLVIGNRTGSELDAPTQRQGILESGDSDGNYIAANRCEGNVEAGIQVVGVHTQVVDNTGSVVRL